MHFVKEMHSLPVYDGRGKLVGHLEDVVISSRGELPKATGVIILFEKLKKVSGVPFVEDAQNVKVTLPWKQVRSVVTDRVTLAVPLEKIQAKSVAKNELLVREHLLDQQLLTRQRAQIGRVNDVILVPERTQLQLVGLCVGAVGLLERLGFEKPLELVGLDHRLDESVIAWRYVRHFRPKKAQIELDVATRAEAEKKIPLSWQDHEVKEHLEEDREES